MEKIFPVTRIKNYPYFYDPFLPNSSRALRNFKNLCAVPVYTRNGPVTVHVVKLLLVEKIPLHCSQLTFFFPYFPKFFLMTFFFFLSATSFFTPSINFSFPPKNFFPSLIIFHPSYEFFYPPPFPKHFSPSVNISLPPQNFLPT